MEADPQFFQIDVRSDCRAAYASRVQSKSEPEVVHFTMPQPDCGRIFTLARQAHYFNGQFDYRRHKIAQTGAKTIAYRDDIRDYKTSFNWSQNQFIESLTDICESVSRTLESGRKLRSDVEHQPLALDGDLKLLQSEVARGEARDLSLMAPVLQQIAGDQSVMHIAQQRARSLLASAQRGK